MPQTVKIMNWNIEQLGETRSSEDDRIKRIVTLITDSDPDIVSIIELKTTSDITAIKIADKILKQMGNSTTYRYILSYQNLLEVHCYFYKSDKIIPICIKSGISGVLDSKNLLKESFVEADGKNTTIITNNKVTEFCNYFPLVEYDDREQKNMRPPCAGFFKTKNSGKYFSLLAWHNAAGSMKGNDYKPVGEMKSLAKTDYITNKKFTIDLNNNKIDIDNIIISGDFNVDYLTNGRPRHYTAFNGYTTVFTQVGEKTHLHKYNPDNDTKYTTYDDLKSSLFDNFIITNNITVTGKSVVDIPYYIKNKGDNFIINLFKDAGINKQKVIIDRVKKSSKFPIEKIMKEHKVERSRLSKVMKHQSKMTFINGKMSPKTFELIDNVLNDSELTKAIKSIVNKSSKKNFGIHNRAKKYIKKPGIIIKNDLLMLSQFMYSDHLPTIVDITL